MLILYKLYLSYKGLQLTKTTGELLSYPCSSIFSQGLWYNFQSFSKLHNRILLKAWTTLIIKKFILSLRIYLDIYKNTCSFIVILSGISLYTCTCRKNHMTRVEIFLEVHNWIYLKIYKKWITLIRILQFVQQIVRIKLTSPQLLICLASSISVAPAPGTILESQICTKKIIAICCLPHQ